MSGMSFIIKTNEGTATYLQKQYKVTEIAGRINEDSYFIPGLPSPINPSSNGKIQADTLKYFFSGKFLQISRILGRFILRNKEISLFPKIYPGRASQIGDSGKFILSF